MSARVAGAGAKGVLGVLEVAGEVVVCQALGRGAELVGDVEGGEDGDAEGVDGIAVGGDGAHLGVDDGGEALDVVGVGAAEIVDLVVDVDGDGLALRGLGDGLLRGLGGFALLGSGSSVSPSCEVLEEFVDLLEHFFDAAGGRLRVPW